jgi:hypothetical protein
VGAGIRSQLTRFVHFAARSSIGVFVAACLAVAGLVAVPASAGATTTFEMTGGSGTLPGAVVGNPYDVQLDVPGAEANDFVVLNGTIPVGLTLSTSGLISGVPSLPQTATFEVGAYDSGGVPQAFEYLSVVVSSGNPSLDPTLTPLGNSIAAAESSLTGPLLGEVTSLSAELLRTLNCLLTVGCIK